VTTRTEDEDDTMADTPDIRPVGDLPDAIGKTAARELANAGITTLAGVAARSERQLLAIHGVGPKAIRLLGEAMASAGLTFADP
jgi:predicted flap endonuclease-1-like 5' DNA nuclease